MRKTSANQEAKGDRPLWRRRLSLVVVLAGLAVFAWALVSGQRLPALSVETRAGATAAGMSIEPQNFSKFTHTNPQHARLPCLLCHRRDDNSPRPTRSTGHTPCAGCHTQQFADASNPICTICHQDSRSPAVKPFPALRSFNVSFDHATHTRAGARPRSDCVACHRPERRGVALSIPAGASAHTTCFQCHGPRARNAAGEDISSCDTCHSLGGYRRTPESAPAFRVNFSHAEHTRQRLDCAACHTVRAGAAQGRQIASPQPLMHHASARARSCQTCHDGRRVFGGDDFSSCTRCHEGNVWHF